MVLAAKSYYSLRYGVLSVDNLVKIAKFKGHTAFGMADINNTSGIFDFIKACQKNNIKAIVGMEFHQDNEFLYLIVVKNHKGFHLMNKLYSDAQIHKRKLASSPPLSEHYFTIYNINTCPNLLKKNEFIGIRSYDLSQMHQLLKKYPKEKMLILHQGFYLSQEHYQIHKHLRAIHFNTLLNHLIEEQIAHPFDKIPEKDAFVQFFKAYPFLIENTEKLNEECNFEFDYKKNKNLKVFSDSEENDIIKLRELTNVGMIKRFGRENAEAQKRIENELKTIKNLNFVSYFLITWDIIRFAKSQNIHHVGRGSGANSIVAYCLGITDVDPIELNLYFERFINPKRSNPPDFDIDFSWKDRDTITNYVFTKYGDKVALLGTSSTFKGKSIIRELAKIYGLPKEDIDLLIKQPQNARNNYEIAHKITELAEEIKNFPNIRSIHAGGILISDKPITYYSALDFPPKGYPTVQWDMYVAENIHLEKLDILSQRGLGHIFEAKEIIKENQGIEIDIHDINKFKNDCKVKQMLAKGETLGAFYIESPAMRSLLKKLRCNNYITLVAASSIIRPGVAKSGMMKEYIQRFHYPNKFEYLHPVLKEQLGETYGIMVYQEDVLKICHHYANLELSDADVLRRIMSGKTRQKGEFERIYRTFFENSAQKGYPENITKEIWRQIESFAGYSFSKAHSASYAVESFQSLYLKAYFPLEFIVGVINNFGGFYNRTVYFNEAKRYGAELEAPDINFSNYTTRLVGTKIFIGFIHVESLESKFTTKLIAEREKNGIYTSLENFLQRNNSAKEQLTIFIRVGAFRFTKESKSSLLWKMNFYLSKKDKKQNSETKELFQLPIKNFSLPEFEQDIYTDAFDEIELLNFPVKLNLFDLLKSNFKGDIMANDMLNNVNKTVQMVGNLIHIKYVAMSNGKKMNFGTFIDTTGNYFDTVHFSTSLQKYPFTGYGIYFLKGKIIEEFGHSSLDVSVMKKMKFRSDARFA